MTKTIKNNYQLIFALLAMAMFAASLYKRDITLDDAFFAEQAYWVNQTGYSRTELFSGVLDWGNRQYVYHKLHVWQTAAVAKYIGWSPYYFKSIPLIYFLLFLFFVYFYFRNYLSKDDNSAFYVFIALISINIHIVHLSFDNRPEIMMMCVGFLSFLSIRQGETTGKPLFLCLSGMLAGMAALFHLNGMIFVLAGSGLLIYTKSYRGLVLFLLFSVTIFFIYWIEIIMNGAVKAAFVQLINDPAVIKGQTSILGHIEKLVLSPKRYVNYSFDFSYALLFGLTLFMGRKLIKESHELKLLLLYFVIAEVSISLISPGNKNMYLVLHMPFMLIVVAVLIKYINNKSSQHVLSIVLGLYALIQIGSIYPVLAKSNSEIIQQHANIVKKYHIQKSDMVLAPAVFVFNEIGNTNIRALEVLPMVQKTECTKQCIFDYSLKNNVSFMLLANDFGSESSVAGMRRGDTYAGYRLLGIEPGYYVFSSNSTSR